MKRISKIALMTMFFLGLALAQDNQNLDYRHTHYFGGTAGFVSGLGPSYRYWGENNGVQITFMPYYSKGKEESWGTLDLAVNYLKALRESSPSTFLGYRYKGLAYSYVGSHFRMDKTQGESVTYQYYEDYSYSSSSSWQDYANYFFSVGGGVGLQANIGNIALSMGLGYVYWTKFDVDYAVPKKRYSNEAKLTNPSIDLTLQYRFD